jgi:small subunit ribosomal protein S20
MPNTSSAKKALRVSHRKRVFNDRRRKIFRDTVKEMKKLIEAKEVKKAHDMLSAAYKAIDKAAKRGVIEPNAASRKKSRLTKMLNKAGK